MQKGFIGASAELHDHQEARRKREIIFAWGMTVLAIVGAMVSAYLGVKAQKQALNAELQAQVANIKYGLSVEATTEELIQAIEATAKSQSKQKSLDPTVINEVNSILLIALYHVGLNNHNINYLLFSVSGRFYYGQLSRHDIRSGSRKKSFTRSYRFCQCDRLESRWPTGSQWQWGHYQWQ